MSSSAIEIPVAELFAKFPHLRKIEAMWGSAECRKLLFQLMTDTRGGTRQGFPKEHALTLMRLMMEHDRKFPQFEHVIALQEDSRWGDVSRRGIR
ncbi:hypothetical protein AZKH_2873 [Azoarcus sp. KH32C]|nr:hypothetical protein AZKH_2873 [Azoarcus sp. KH32C]